MRNLQLVATLLTGLFMHCVAWSYECDNSIRPFSTPTEKFDIDNDGTLTDIQTGLTWMRCSLGQQWNGKTCEGDAKSYTWQNAIAQAKTINMHGGFAGNTNWRVPKLPELAGLIERQCNNPRINLQLFPRTPATHFWSSSAKNGSDTLSYSLSFGAHGVSIISRNETFLVRLVQGGE